MTSIGRPPRSRARILEEKWAEVAMHERLGAPGRVAALTRRLRREADRAQSEVAPLRRWDRISDRSFGTYLGKANHVRLRRLLDFIRDGDRVLDVGIGFGYVTGILLRERNLEGYCGIDLKDQFLEAVESMAAANGVDLSSCHFEVMDVHDVTPRWMEAHRPDVVLVLEVLEHVPDPLAALSALVRAIPTDATVLFTVPLPGRLEGVWGHVSLFDRRRVEQLCADAGLTVHHVEPLHSTWMLVAASPSVLVPERLDALASRRPRPGRLLRRVARRLPDRKAPGYSVALVPMHHRQDFSRPHDDPARVVLDPRRIGVTCRVRGADDAVTEGGVRLPIPAPGLIRLELTCIDPHAIEEIVVAGVAADGGEHVSWTWKAGRLLVDGERRTHALRVGESSGRFSHRGSDSSAVVAVDVAVRVRAGQTAGFHLHRAGYVTDSSRRGDPPLPAARPEQTAVNVVHMEPGVPEPGNERLLYKGGYLIHETRRPPEPRAEDLARRLAAWPEVTVGRYTLRFDVTWACSHAKAGDIEVVMLGTATHIERPGAGQEVLTAELARALQRSNEAFYDLLDHLSGAHIVLFRIGDRHVLLQDATGMETVLYDVSGGWRSFASHPGLIAELEGYETSEFSRWWMAHPGLHAGGAYFPGLLTPYAELRMLTPNTQLDLDSLQVERFYPRVPLGVMDLDDIVTSVDGWLRNQWEWLNAGYSVSVSLTAGLDSRLTLASARDVAEDLHYFTYSVWGSPSHGRDCEVASRLAERHGLRHDVYRVKSGAPVPEAVSGYWDRMHGGMLAGRVLTVEYLNRFPDGNLHVRSNVLETVRGFYLKNSLNVPDRFDAAKLSRLFRGVTAQEFEPHFDEFARLTSFNAESKLDFHYSDLFYWEHRMGTWHGGMVSRAKTSHDTFVIYNCRKLLQTMLALPLAQRVAALSAWELMDALWPEALEEPILSARGEPLPKPSRESVVATGRGSPRRSRRARRLVAARYRAARRR